jgi:hypothetical protein
MHMLHNTEYVTVSCVSSNGHHQNHKCLLFFKITKFSNSSSVIRVRQLLIASLAQQKSRSDAAFDGSIVFNLMNSSFNAGQNRRIAADELVLDADNISCTAAARP